MEVPAVVPECGYCDESFEDEAAYVDHLAEEHAGDLSRIDRRRVDQHQADDGQSRAVLYGAAALVVVLLAGAVYVTVFAGGDDPSGPEAQPLPDRGDEALLQAVEEFPSQGRNHVSTGTQVDYSTTPPTSGPHYGSWTDPGYYTDAQPAGGLVHSLEHGYVVIYYDPAEITPEAEESLRTFAAAHDQQWQAVVVVPSDDIESPYVLTAWQAMLRMDGYDAETVRAFLAEYLGRGPEHPVR